MCIIVNYYKLGDTWYLDLPEYLEKEGTYEEDLERIGSFHDFLELAAQGKQALRFEIDEQPKEAASLLQLTGVTGDDEGAYYHLKEFNGEQVDLELWFNRVIHHFVETPPGQLYIRQLN